ncbi:hypothetical protein DdX_21798 [Ditylenchus destructor]|uniref:Uncharacterized protein n=1 Tax=Ditylenchus destructor TaxID=166010 RepID=A0AAD4MF58_9BILA|nr:hypothetical protein DdX_21798 [Ditylenchus destructor]
MQRQVFEHRTVEAVQVMLPRTTKPRARQPGMRPRCTRWSGCMFVISNSAPASSPSPGASPVGRRGVEVAPLHVPAHSPESVLLPVLVVLLSSRCAREGRSIPTMPNPAGSTCWSRRRSIACGSSMLGSRRVCRPLTISSEWPMPTGSRRIRGRRTRAASRAASCRTVAARWNGRRPRSDRRTHAAPWCAGRPAPLPHSACDRRDGTCRRCRHQELGIRLGHAEIDGKLLAEFGGEGLPAIRLGHQLRIEAEAVGHDDRRHPQPVASILDERAGEHAHAQRLDDLHAAVVLGISTCVRSRSIATIGGSASEYSTCTLLPLTKSIAGLRR